MRPSLVIAFLFLGVSVGSSAEPVHVFIAPRSVQLPPSGKMVFDVYWLNESGRPAAIPSLDCYDVVSLTSVPGREGGAAGGTGLVVDHPTPDRRIAPYALVHDTISTRIDLKPKEFVEVFIRFKGDRRKEFESNHIIFLRK